MKMLAIEFSSSQRSMAVAESDLNGHISALYEVVEKGPTATRAVAMVDEVLGQAGMDRGQIQCVVVGLGPGSYTGIRCAISFAQGWQLGSKVTLLGLSSMDCLAEHAFRAGIQDRIHTIVDAQRNELYLATYESASGRVRCVEPLKIATEAEARERAAPGGTIVGPESTRWFADGRVLHPSAAVLCHLAARGAGVSAPLEPIYLRQPSFVKAARPRAGLNL